MGKKLEIYLKEHIGKACILETSLANGTRIKYAGELLDVYEDGFVRLRTIDDEIICNLKEFQTIKVK